MSKHIPAVIPHHPLVIGNISISQDTQGRYCLNDLHKAACKYLQAEAKRYQSVINDWYNRNSLFNGGAQ